MLFIAILPLASGELLFNQPQPLYNLGDELNMIVTVHATNAVNDFLRVKMVCDGNEIELYRSALHLTAGASKDVAITTQLNHNIIADLKGTCTLEASLDGDTRNSAQFQLSNMIDVDFSLSATSYNPGESVRITGTAKKANGQQFSGPIDAQISGRNRSVSGVASNGAFSLNMTLPEDFAPGQLIMRVSAVERDSSNQVANEGTHETSFSVRVVLRNLEITLNNESIAAGDSITFTVNAYDQAANVLDKDTKVTLFSPQDVSFISKLVRTGAEQTFALNQNASPGYWKVQAETEGMIRKKLFYVPENAHIRFEIANTTLVITNIGNVRYTQPIEIIIGNATYVRDLDLGVGQVKKYKLYGEDSTYSVSVKGGEDASSFDNIPLTGRAINLGEVREGYFKASYATIFLLVLVALVLFMNFYVRKRGSMRGSMKMSKESPAGKTSAGTMKMSALTTSEGKKEPASVVAFKTPNGVIPPKAQDVLERARREGVKVYNDEEYKLMLFSPSLTKKQDHELLAAKCAQEVESVMKEHNSRGRNTVQFGIGAVSGSIISEMKQGKFEFTAVGTLIPGAKRLATLSEGNVLLSPTTHRPIMNVVKAEKVNTLGAYKLNAILDRAKHESFLKGFLGRNKS